MLGVGDNSISWTGTVSKRLLKMRGGYNVRNNRATRNIRNVIEW